MAFAENYVNQLVYMTSSVLEGTAHAFTTRCGGVSEGIYESLNLGVNRGDARESVCENYDRIMRVIGVDKGRLVFTKQVHGTRVRCVTGKDCCGDIFAPGTPECDGLITRERGLPLIIFTADCIPVLLYDPAVPAVGAVHAGWRGTVGDIVGEAVRCMADEFGSRPEDIRAAIGPGISACCFETGAEVAAAVTKLLGKEGASFCRPQGEKYYVDLKAINRALLLRAGLKDENIDISDECTMCSHEKYWSHRHTNGERGSQAEIIMLTKE